MKQTGTRRGWRVALSAFLLAAGLVRGGSHSADSSSGRADFRDYTLTVASDHLTPTPGVGTHTYAWGATVTCSVVDDSATHDLTGWTGTGSVPATGAELTTGALVLDEVAGSTASSITWTWRIATYALVVENGSGGGSYTAGTAVTVAADAAPLGQEFAGWVTDPSAYVANLADTAASPTTFTMPAAMASLTATYVDIAYSGGLGTQANPYRIATAQDLLDLAANVAHYGKHFLLTADIDLAGHAFTAAVIAPTVLVRDGVGRGTELDFHGTAFSGTLAGGGHVIRNLTIDTGGAAGKFLGLFGRVGPGAEVTGLGIVGTVKGGSLSYVVGLLCAENLGTIRGCSADGNVEVGIMSSVIGGLCGHSDGRIGNCYATTAVVPGGGTMYGGGLCGYNTGTIDTSYSAGAVPVGASLGGLCGESAGTVTRCFWDTETSGTSSSVGGTGKTTAMMQTQATFLDAGWDFVGETANGTFDTWNMDGYPTLSRFDLATTHRMTVQSGSGSGSYPVGADVAVLADAAPEGQEFAGWMASPSAYAANLAAPSADSTTFTMGAADVTLAATYVVKTYTVTFDLGAHGTWTGGGELSQTVDHGTAATEPEFTVATGWTFTGWGTGFDNVTADLVVEAAYTPLPPLWQFDMEVEGGSPSTLAAGMALGATDGWDDGLDVQCPLPVSGQVRLVADDLSLSYSADYRAIAPTAEFLLIASAPAGATITVSWGSPDLPAGKLMSLYEVVLDGMLPSRTAAARTLVGNTALDMAVTRSLEIPAGETRCYVIRYGDDLVFDLSLLVGWNLVSLPIDPRNPAVGAVLGDGLRGAITRREVCTLDGQDYVPVAEMHGCVGYWVYAAEPAVLLVAGSAMAQQNLALLQGWNLCGVTEVRDVSEDALIRGKVWMWDAQFLQYVAVTELLPGRGYCIGASEDANIPLGER